MIGQLRGQVLAKQTPFLVLEVNGVGYEIEVATTTLAGLPTQSNVEVTLYTHLVVREDAHLLYGFLTLDERNLFRELLKVSGIGPKVALAILAGLPIAQLLACIETRDVTRLTTIPGIGKKTAERLLVELQGRLKEWQFAAATASVAFPTTPSTQNAASQDAVSALIALGYKPIEATRAVNKIYQPEHSSAELIRLALKGQTANASI